MIERGFSTEKIYEGETISYWADLNLSRRRKSYDESGPLPEDSPIVINTKRIKEVIDDINVNTKTEVIDIVD